MILFRKLHHDFCPIAFLLCYWSISIFASLLLVDHSFLPEKCSRSQAAFCKHSKGKTRSHIHERTISLKFLGISLRVLRLEISVYNVYITNQFQTTFARGGGGGGVVKSVSGGDSDFCPNYIQEFSLRTSEMNSAWIYGQRKSGTEMFR